MQPSRSGVTRATSASVEANDSTRRPTERSTFSIDWSISASSSAMNTVADAALFMALTFPPPENPSVTERGFERGLIGEPGNHTPFAAHCEAFTSLARCHDVLATAAPVQSVISKRPGAGQRGLVGRSRQLAALSAKDCCATGRAEVRTLLSRVGCQALR